MNRKISVIFLSTVLPTALLADTNGLTSEILNRAKSVKADAAAFQDSMSDARGMHRATTANEVASIADTRAAPVAGKFSSVENQITNEPSSLKASLSPGSNIETQMTNKPSSLKSFLSSGSKAETQMTNEPSSLQSSLSSGSKAETQMTNEPSSLQSSLLPN